MNVIVIINDTLRRDHCGPYHQGRPLNVCGSPDAPDWVVATPHIDRLAARGTVFDSCWCGSTPCMPARRDVYTGRYEFLRRGWGPLEDDDLDLPRQVSGSYPGRTPPAIPQIYASGYSVSYLVTDHVCLWESGSGNYHMGYTGFEFIRGNQEDPWRTDPVDPHTFFCPDYERNNKIERYFRNVHYLRKHEDDYSCARVFRAASEWLRSNYEYRDFYLHIDSYDPHEPWDPPEEMVKIFDPHGYDVPGWNAHPPYAPWREVMNEQQFTSYRARYAAKVVLVDRWLGFFLDTMDELNLWDDTLLIFTTDHGTFNGDFGLIGKEQTHEYGCKSHIPFIMRHPVYGHGERRNQLVQLVDIYPTVLTALNRDIPKGIHGVDLGDVLKNPDTPTRDYALAGKFGCGITITDGRWVLHQKPVDSNKPLYWYGHHQSRFADYYDLGPYYDGRRCVTTMLSDGETKTETWLSDTYADPCEYTNQAGDHPEKLRDMQCALLETLNKLDAPPEQAQRLGL